MQLHKKKKHVIAGFSLIELMVAVGIFVLISMVVLVNHSRFNSSVLLGSLAYEVGLSIREAQVFGLSVRGTATGGIEPLQFDFGYGVNFKIASPTEYILFSDIYPTLNPNRRYEVQDQTVQTYRLGKGHYISKLCGTSSSGVEYCSDSPLESNRINSLDIVFVRPNPDARITSDRTTHGEYSSGRIVVSAPGGETREVHIQSTGQISIQRP